MVNRPLEGQQLDLSGILVLQFTAAIAICSHDQQRNLSAQTLDMSHKNKLTEKVSTHFFVHICSPV